MRRFGGRNTFAIALAVGVGLVWLATKLMIFARPLLAAAVIVFVVAAAFWLIESRRAWRHRRQMVEFAQNYGWHFTRLTRDYSGRFDSFPFATGTGARQEDILTGTLNGVECATFTHTYDVETERGKSIPQAFQISLVELPVILPTLELVPEDVASRFAQAFGARDLDVESYTFNKRWRVVCRDHRYAHAVLDPRMIERLLEPDAWGLAIRIEGGAVMAWQAEITGTETLAARLGVLTAVARRIPEHVVREYRERGHTNYSGKNRPIPDGAPDWATTPGALTSGKATGIEPGPAASGEAYGGLPWGDERASFNIFDWGAGPLP